MTDLEDILAQLWSRVDGCRVAAIAGMDGLLIERHPRQNNEPAGFAGPSAAELDVIVADVTSLISITAGALSRQVGGRVDEVVAIGPTGGYLARRIGSDLFCLLIVGPGTDLANLRRQAETVSAGLQVELA